MDGQPENPSIRPSVNPSISLSDLFPGRPARPVLDLDACRDELIPDRVRPRKVALRSRLFSLRKLAFDEFLYVRILGGIRDDVEHPVDRRERLACAIQSRLVPPM